MFKYFKNINPIYKQLYILLFKVIVSVLLFSLASICLTTAFYGALIVAAFLYLTAIIFTIKSIKDSINSFINLNNKN